VAGRPLSLDERLEIDRWWHARDRGLSGESLRSLARRMGRCPSVISREVTRNRSGKFGYHAAWAQRKTDRRRRRPKPARLARPGLRRTLVLGWLREGWSPQQIAGRLRRDFPDRPELQVSHETIYQAVCLVARGGLRRELDKALRTGRTRRRPRTGRVAGGRGNRAWAVPRIAERPEEITGRLVPGHWEGDLVIGKGGGSAIVTLVERHSRLVLLGRLPAGARDSAAVIAAIHDRMLALPQALRRSLTWDQGSEMAGHAALRLGEDFRVYFCDPHSPWQRPSNENANGLIREYFPKGVTDFDTVEQDYLDLVADKLNGRPRAVLDFMTPSEALGAALVACTA
jgi:transposase, IS30 family